LCTCWSYWTSRNSLHRTWHSPKDLHGLGSTKIASQATRTKEGGPVDLLGKTTVQGRHEQKVCRRCFIVAKLYSLRFPENGSLEQKANDDCQQRNPHSHNFILSRLHTCVLCHNTKHETMTKLFRPYFAETVLCYGITT
jgi:hypothetical protein